MLVLRLAGRSREPAVTNAAVGRAGKAGGPDRAAGSRPVRRRRSGLVRLGCTAVAACGYATGVGGSATVTVAGGVHGFPAALTSFIGRDGPLREVAGLLNEYRLVTCTVSRPF